MKYAIYVFAGVCVVIAAVIAYSRGYDQGRGFYFSEVLLSDDNLKKALDQWGR